MRKCKQKFAWLLTLIMFFSTFSPAYARSMPLPMNEEMPTQGLAPSEQTTSSQLTTTGSALVLDKTKLEALIRQAQEIDKVLYTQASVKVLEEVLERAVALSQKDLNLDAGTISQEEIDKLILELQAALKGLTEKEVKQAILSIERSTLGQPFYMEPRVIEFVEGENVAQALVRELGEGNYEYTGSPESGFYLAQVLLRDDLAVDIPGCILEYAELTADEIDPQDDEWLGEFDHTFMSGWIYWVNHVHMPYGMSDATLEDGDVVRLQFTVWGYGADLGLGAEWSQDAPKYTVANKDALITEIAYVNEDKSNLETNPAVKAAYDEAIELVYNLLSTQEEVDAAVEALQHAQTIPPTDKTKLESLMNEVKEMNQILYTDESIKVLNNALDQALLLYKDQLATQEAVDQAILELEEALFNLIKKPIQEAVFVIERSTIGQPFYLEPTKVQFVEGENVAQILVKTLGEGQYKHSGSPESGFYLSQLKLKDQLDLNIPQCVLDYAGRDATGFKENKDEWLGEFDHSGMSGWMYWVNHESMPYGMSQAYPKAGDVVRFQFTLWGYGGDLGLDTGWGMAAPYTTANKDELFTELAKLNQDKSILADYPALQKAYDEAVVLGENIVATQEAVEAVIAKLKYLQETPPTDKMGLEALLVEAEKLDQSLYTEESLKAFVRAIQTAKEVIADVEATQVSVDAAQTQLKTAKALLVLKPVVVIPYEQALADVLDTMYHNTPNPGFGTFDGEWTVLSIARGGYPYSKDYVNGYYEKVEKVVKDKKGQLHKVKYTEYSRLILALAAIGKDVTDIAGYNLLEYLADFDKVTWQGINGPTFALIALDTHQYEIPQEPNGKNQTTRDKLIEEIVKQEISGGGFALMGSRPDVDITAMVLQALAPYKERSDVKTVVDRAVALLSELQNQEGGYANAFGGADGGAASTSESTSQVIVALSALGIDAMYDERFIKNGKNPVDDLLTYYVSGQGFKHLKDGSVDAMATDQAAYALVAYDRLAKGQNRLYDMMDVEIIYADKAILKELIEEAKLIQNEDYTSASWAYFKESLAHAEAIYKEVTAKQVIVDKAAKILQDSIEKLEIIPIEEVPVVEGKVEISYQDEEKMYQVTIDETKTNPITITIAKEVTQKVYLKVEPEDPLPQITVVREGNSLTIPEGTSLSGGSRIDLFTELNKEVQEEIKAQLLEQMTEKKVEVTVNALYEFGDKQDVKLSQPATLVFSGLAGQSAQYRDADKVLHPITDSQNVGEDLVLTVDHLGQLVIYTVKQEEGGDIPTPPNPPVVPDDKLYITLSIDKLTINMGYVIPPTKVEFTEGENVWDVLKREMDNRGITYEYEWTEKYGSIYVQSIAGDGEFDHGRWSGWMYNVNGWYPNYGASKYILKDGDVVEWRYTTNLGDDLGVDNSEWDTYPDGTPKDPATLLGKDGVLTNVPYPAKNYDYTLIEGMRIKNKDLRSYKDDADISPWAVNAIKIASALEIIEGSEGSFYPQKEVTRAEFTKMLAVLLDLEIESVFTNTFEDVKFEDWYMPYVEAAYKAGIVQGDGKKFNPASTITREEMAAMLMRIMELEEVALDEPVKDSEESAIWAKEAIEKVYSNGLMTGRDHSFYPKANVTREMATVALVRVYKKINNIVPAEMQEEVKEALDTTTDYIINTVQEPNVGSIGGEWAIFGLARRGAKVPEGYYEDYYKRVEKVVKEEEAKTERKWKTKVTELQRLSIALTAIGKNPENVVGVNLVDYSWNKEKNMADLSENDRILGNRQGLNELVFGLITIDLKGSDQPVDATVSRDSIIYKILNTYTTQDGGFNLREHEVKADVDMTAMTLQSLAPYYKEDNYDYLTEAVDRALETLSKKQTASGGFENDYGGADGGTAETSESTAQVVVALCALGIDPHQDPRFIKNGRSPIDDLMSYYVEGGGFKHLHELEVDQMATEQAYYALVAYERFVNGQSPIYNMMDVEKSR